MVSKVVYYCRDGNYGIMQLNEQLWVLCDRCFNVIHENYICGGCGKKHAKLDLYRADGTLLGQAATVIDIYPAGRTDERETVLAQWVKAWLGQDLEVKVELS